jgi:probable O-glycosylation ligase (exosortase A-associated)
MIVALPTVIGFFAHGMARKGAGSRWPAEKVLLLVLAALTLMSVVDAVDRDLAMVQLDDFAKIFLMLFIACALLDSRRRIYILAVTLVICLGWVAFDFNQRYIFMGQKHITTLGFAGIDNNGLAALMVIAMPLCMFLFLYLRKWYLKWPALLAALLMLHMVLFSMSRAGMLASLIMLPVLLLRLKKKWLSVALMVLVVVIGLRMAGPKVRRRFLSIGEYGQDTSIQTRLALWRSSLDVIRDYPILGVGPNCFRRVAGEYDFSLRNRTMHNRFLQTAVDMGVPALGVLASVLILSLWRLQRLRKRHRDDPFVFHLATCLQASILGYVLTGMFASTGTIELPYIVLAMSISLQNVVAVERPSLALKATAAERRLTRLSLGELTPATTP